MKTVKYLSTFRRHSMMAGVSAIALAGVAVTISGGSASAACGINPSGVYSTPIQCLPITGPADITVQSGANISTASGGGSAVFSRATDANATVDIDGTTITTSGGSTFGVRAQGTGTTGDAIVNFTGTNVLTLAAGDDTGVLTLNAGSGRSEINVIGSFNLTNNSDNSAIRDGLEANAAAGGSAAITHHGSGTITVHGGNAIVVAGSGTATGTVDVGNNVTLIVDNTVSGASGSNNSAIRGITTHGANSITSAATVQTSGNNAYGIYASASGLVITQSLARALFL